MESLDIVAVLTPEKLQNRAIAFVDYARTRFAGLKVRRASNLSLRRSILGQNVTIVVFNVPTVGGLAVK